MDERDVIESLQQKSIFITGSTGFLSKILVEKVLRIQPNVKRLYLLVRAEDDKTAMRRVEEEVIQKELFKVLREKQGANFDSFISEKVTAVAGDITYDNLGVNDTIREELCREVQIFINAAATTSFEERYDVALGINTMGAKHVLGFAKKCVKLEMLLHVSTAYVAGVKEGIILEKPLKIGEYSALDIEAELKVAQERLKQLQDHKVSTKVERIAMKELGMERSRLFGWPNTYVFTKSMGEMILGELKEDVPLLIIRPTIVTSTYAQPFPGWIEGTRTIDAFLAAYASGKLNCFLGNLNLVADVIPGDMVVNAMLVMVATHHSNRPSNSIYHLGSSVRNPIRYSLLKKCIIRYFSHNPQMGKDGKPIKPGPVTVFEDAESFKRYMALCYKMPLQVLGLANAVSCHYFDDIYNKLNRQYRSVMRLVNVYGPYLYFKGRFDDKNAEQLRGTIREGKMLGFDPKEIDWEHYLMNVHIPGVVRLEL